MPELEEEQVEEVEEVEEVDTDLEDDDDDDDDLENFNSETFLQSIEDEALRSQLEPHVKRWDAGVTRRFQDLHSRYRPYQELGEFEELAQAQQLYQMLEERPQELYQALAEALGTNNVQQGAPGPQGYSPQQQQAVNQLEQQGADGLSQQQYAQLPPEYKQQLDQHSTLLNTLAEAYLQQETTRKQAEEDAELDNYLSNLKTEFGDFDEEWVLLKMSQGIEGPKAVKQYHRNIQRELAKRAGDSAPQILSGGGQVAQETLNVGEMGDKDVKSLVAGLIEQANQE